MVKNRKRKNIYFIILIALIILIINCSKKDGLIYYEVSNFIEISEFSDEHSGEEKSLKIIKEILSDIDNCKYKKALEKLDTINPDFYFRYLNINIPLLYGLCYLNELDFEKANEYFSKGDNNWKTSYMDEVFNYSYFDAIYLRANIKMGNFEKTMKLYDRFLEAQDKYFELEKIGFIKNSVFKKEILIYFVMDRFRRDALIDNIIMEIVYKKNEYDKDLLKIMYKNLITINNIQNTFVVLFDLLNYKLKDGSFPSDIIWKEKVTKKYFKKLYRKKLISKDTLLRLKEMVPRKELPEDFVKLFDDFE